MNAWAVQDAKARFSELLERSLAEGPQLVTRRGQAAAVLVPIKQWNAMQAAAPPRDRQAAFADHELARAVVTLADLGDTRRARVFLLRLENMARDPIDRRLAARLAGSIGRPDHAVWVFPGRTGKIAGRHEGRAGILGFLMNVMGLTDGTFHLDLDDVVAGDRHAVALFRGHGRRGDKVLDNPTCLRMRIVEGQIVEIHEFVWDLFAVDDFWS